MAALDTASSYPREKRRIDRPLHEELQLRSQAVQLIEDSLTPTRYLGMICSSSLSV